MRRATRALGWELIEVEPEKVASTLERKRPSAKPLDLRTPRVSSLTR